MKRILSTLLALCLLLGLTPAALGAEPVEETFQYTWSQKGDIHTVTRVDAQGDPVIEEGKTAFTSSGTSPWNTIIAIYDDAEIEHQVFSFILTLTTDVTLVGEPEGDADVQGIVFQDGAVRWELNAHTLTLDQLQLGASRDNVTTFSNGGIVGVDLGNHNMLYALHDGALILDSVTAHRDDGGALVSAKMDEEETPVSVTIKNSNLTTGVSGMDAPLGNALLVNGKNASVTLESTAVTGHAPTYPIASVTDGTLTVDENSSITATAETVAAAIVNGGHLHLNGGTLTPGAGGYACGGRTNGTLHLVGKAAAASVELRAGDQIDASGYTGENVVLTCTGGQAAGDLLVTGGASEEAAKKFTSSAQNPVGIAYMEKENGKWTLAAAEAPGKADNYTMTQDQYDRYIVTGTYGDGSTYVLINEEPSFKTTIDALFNDVQGTGATIKLGDDLTIVGTPKGDGSYPTTGVGEGWITWDLQRHTLHLDNLCMIAQVDGVLTVKNGTVAFTGGTINPGGALFGAQDNGRMVVENVTATRDDGGCLLGAYDTDQDVGGQIMATGCALSSGNALARTAENSGTNAIYAGANSTVKLVGSTVTSTAHWAGANITGGTLEADAASTITAAAGCAAAGAENGTIRLQGATLSGAPALRDWGGGVFSLSGNTKAATIEIAGPGVVDAADYTGGDVTLTYTGADVLANVPLVSGCNSAETAQKFKLTTGAPVNIVYKEQPGGTWAAVAAATPLSSEVTAFTEGTVYSISSKEEMERLAALVNGGNSGAGSFFALTGDVDLEGGEENQWPSIGKKGGGEDAPFAGVFDGGGHTVSGLYINRAENVDKGLFSYVASGGGVRNLTVGGQAAGGDFVGGLVSHNKGLIENCVSNVSVSGEDGIGGLVSANATPGALLNCVNNGAVKGDLSVGGIVSASNSACTVTGCVNNGAVEGGDDVGGIVGSNHGAVTDCANHGAILGAEDVGGVTGRSMYGSIVRCQNNGSVSFYETGSKGDNGGGIAGYTESAAIEDCVNTGGVTSRLQTGHTIGGIVGSSGGGTLKTCYNIGAVSCAGKLVGGVVGYMSSTAVTSCVSLGLSVSGGEQAGRVVGSIQSGTCSAGFARSDLSLTGGTVTTETATQTGRDGESITLTGDWQETAFEGWDFSTVWNEGEGDSLPSLKAVKTAPITLPRPASDGGSSDSGESSDSSGSSGSSSKPSVTAGEGGTVKADSKGNVTITPDEGWRIASVTVNGKAVDIPENGVLTGLKSRDKVAVTFEQIPPEPVFTPDQFTDLDPDAWYYDAVTYVLANGLFRGTSENTFSPAAPMSRAMLFTVLQRISGEAGEATDGTSWYASALAWAMEHGISDGSNPDGEITREQLATMLYRYAKTLPGDTPEGSGAAAAFSDHDVVSGYAEEAVQWAVGHGILTGKGNGTLDPTGAATRAETAVMLQRFIEMKTK